MKLTLERAALLKSLTHVQNIVERRNTIPILSNVKLMAEAGALSMNATDLDLELNETVPAGVDQPGSITAPAHTLHEIIRKLPAGAQVDLSLSPDAGQLALRSGRSQFHLSCLPVEDFPVMAAEDLPVSFRLAAADLRSLIDRTSFAISTEETRYYLNGIYFHATTSNGVEVLRAVATDGHRLARVEVPLPEGAAGMPGIIVPRKTVLEVRKLIDETGMDVTVHLSDSKIRFAFDDAVLTSKLIDGSFPDYERVIPADNDKVLEVDRKALFDAVDRVSAISTEKGRAIKLEIEKGSMKLNASSADSGSAEEEIEAAYEAGQIEIGFNARYLMEILKQIEGDAVRLALADHASPTIIGEVADASAVYVLMPMRV